MRTDYVDVMQGFEGSADTELWPTLISGFSLEDFRSADVDHYEKWYSDRQDYLTRMFVRARLYLPYIFQEVERRRMPAEIALLPAIESAYKPDALSGSGASGLWQFIPSTADIFGLQRNDYYDGRQDVILATGAALDYLEELYSHFRGDWFLALAAYNGGKGYISRAIQSNLKNGRPADYVNLELRSETRRFVPKLMALRNIVATPDRWGLQLPSVEKRPYFFSIDAPAGSRLESIAANNSIDINELRALNPALKKWVVPADGPYRLLIPVTPGAGLADRPPEIHTLDSNNTAGSPNSGWRIHHSDNDKSMEIYRVKPGDTLSSISRKFSVPVNRLVELNSLPAMHSLSPGEYLRILAR